MEYFIVILIIIVIAFLVYRYYKYKEKLGPSPQYTKRRTVFLLFLGFTTLFGFSGVVQYILEHFYAIYNPDFFKYGLIGFSIFSFASILLLSIKTIHHEFSS